MRFYFFFLSLSLSASFAFGQNKIIPQLVIHNIAITNDSKNLESFTKSLFLHPEIQKSSLNFLKNKKILNSKVVKWKAQGTQLVSDILTLDFKEIDKNWVTLIQKNSEKKIQILKTDTVETIFNKLNGSSLVSFISFFPEAKANESEALIAQSASYAKSIHITVVNCQDPSSRAEFVKAMPDQSMHVTACPVSAANGRGLPQLASLFRNTEHFPLSLKCKNCNSNGNCSPDEIVTEKGKSIKFTYKKQRYFVTETFSGPAIDLCSAVMPEALVPGAGKFKAENNTVTDEYCQALMNSAHLCCGNSEVCLNGFARLMEQFRNYRPEDSRIDPDPSQGSGIR